MTLNTLLTKAAAAAPDRCGLVGLQANLSWRQLEQNTAAVASVLVEAGIVPGDRVGVACLKDVQAYLAVHGILRAGAVVVPVDPLAPALAAREVLADAQVSGLIGDSRTVGPIDPWNIESLNLRLVVVAGETSDPRVVPWTDVMNRPARAALPIVAPEDPAYLIYTSGSSGRPKGIVHTHASGMAYAERAARAHQLSEHDRLAGMSAFHFDMSTFELYAAPLARSAVVVMGEAHLRFPASFTARSQDERVSVWYSVPSLFRQVVERGAIEQRELSELRLVMYGGEPYPGGALAELMRSLPFARIKNIYGPAEVNECTNHTVTVLPEPDRSIPIGKPWDGVDLRVVDEHGTTVGPGTSGELWVSAPTVMSGYWNQPDRSAASLHSREARNPWYRTGDIVVEDHDGVFWFKGRRDHQVKIRGVRLELEAVESVLSDAPAVLHAVVGLAANQGANQYLTAAVVFSDGAESDLEAVRRWCIQHLSQVAVPGEIVQWADFPRTPTGKIDRRRVRQELGDARKNERAEL